MAQESRRPLLLETFGIWSFRQLRNHWIPLTASILFGLLAYVFAFTNKLVNHDEVHCLFSKGATVDSGRWGLGLLDSIFPNYSMPWIYGIITVLLISLSICLVIGIFQIRNKLLQILLAGCIMVFPSLIGTFGYMFTSSSYALSFLLAVLSVWLLQQRSLRHILGALVCMVASLSIYQSYIAVCASLLVLVLIRQLLKNEQPFSVLRRGCFFVLFLLVSLALYYIGSQVVFRVTGKTFNDYAQSSITFRLSAIPQKICVAYEMFLRFFTEKTCRLIPTDLSQLAHGLCMLCCAVLLLLWCIRQRKNPIQLLLLLILTAILPLAINCMYLITSEESIHTLVLYGFVAVYILVIILAEDGLEFLQECGQPPVLRRLALNIATLCLSLIILINIYIANGAYLNLHLRYENAYAFYTSLWADIKAMPEFDEDTQLAITGYWQSPVYYEEHFEFAHELTGIYGFNPDSYSNESFLKYYIGVSIPFAQPEEIAAITESAEYEAMPVYPYYGSMQMFDDILVVKLS